MNTFCFGCKCLQRLPTYSNLRFVFGPVTNILYKSLGFRLDYPYGYLRATWPHAPLKNVVSNLLYYIVVDNNSSSD